MWVKICGNTNLEDAQHALEAGADALGFVFAASPRQVSFEQMRRIAPHLPGGCQSYGVFVDESVEVILRTVLECGLSGVQLHSTREPRMAETLRRHLIAHHAETTKIVTVLTFSGDLKDQLDAAAESADAVLVDTRSAVRAGGTGLRWDWSRGSAAFRSAIGKVRVIAAGGLSPANVKEAIETLTPWGVDVVTGVESSPGRKDWTRVEAFIAAAKRVRTAGEAVGEPVGAP